MVRLIFFRKRAPRLKLPATKTAVKTPLSHTCQDLLMDAISVELCYHATGVEYLNSDDYFISQERKQRCIYYDALKDKKEEHEDKRIQHKNAQSVIQDFQKKKNENSYNDIDMQALLLSELKVLYK